MTEPELSAAVIPLMKGAVYRDTHDRAWKQLLQLQPHVRDYVAVLGLQVVIDEAEGYAFLRQRPVDPDDTDPPPRLIPRHALSFHVSLLLATSNDARLIDKLDEHITKVAGLGFLRPVKNAEQSYEVRRILKAFIDGQWLADLDARLAEYAGSLTPDATGGDGE